MNQKLNDLLTKAYAPYSHFQVAAILITKDGRIFNGVNIENASYGATVCAERVAIFKAISEGYGKGDFKELHLMSSSHQESLPCFLCRQVFTEFMTGDENLIIYTDKGNKTYKLSTLLPYPFVLEGSHA